MKKIYEKLSPEALTAIDATVTEAAKRLEAVIEPSRSTLAKRYPTFFSLMATFGVAATFLGFEQLLLEFSLLERYPLLIFILGIGILTLTGTLYKKLQ